jgi:hypothetical protein
MIRQPDVRALDSVYHTGKRLHERADLEGKLPNVEGGSLGDDDIFLHAARQGHTDRLPVQAKILTIV